MKFNFQLKALMTYIQTILCSTIHVNISVRLIDDYDNKALNISFDKSTGLYHVVYVYRGFIRMDDLSETIAIDLDKNFIKVTWIDKNSEIKSIYLYEPRIKEDMI